MDNKPRAIFFDLDDTLIADDFLSEGVWREVCARYAPRLEGVTPDRLYTLIRSTASAYWADAERHRRGRLELYKTRRNLVVKALVDSGTGSEALGQEIADSYSALKEQLIAPVPGAIETLEKIRQKGIRLALITNGGSEVQRKKLERFGLSAFFEYILVEGEFGAGKPDARVFQSCLANLGVKPEEVWMVGDDLNRDIGGALPLGIRAIWVDWRGKGLPPDSKIKPWTTIKAVPELLSEIMD
ncbi:MAG TPA: HAD-IA family hydrolase [Dehalococcoidales bacterium]|nr:HAD-IA family hydrolase [Dehalococcoidales bacterium]